jgi:hypothetical protein
MAKAATSGDPVLNDIVLLSSSPLAWSRSIKWDTLFRGTTEDDEDVLNIAKALEHGAFDSMVLLDVSETSGSHAVQIFLQKHLEDSVVYGLCFDNLSLKKFASAGRVSLDSKPDGTFRAHITTHSGVTLEVIVGVLEWKGTHQSLSGPLRQAVGEAVNVAFHLYANGVLAQDVYVPVVVCNGRLIQFGVVSLIDPCYPIFTTTSFILDLASPVMRLEAARHMHVCGKLTRSYDDMKLGSIPDAATVDTLRLRAHYAKPLSNFSTVGDSMEVRMFKMVLALQKLHSSEIKLDSDSSLIRDHIVFPLGVSRKPSKEDQGFIVFNNLAAEGFRIGLPDDNKVCAAFVARLRELINAIHVVGVVHTDLYLSNVMWKVQDGAVIIKLIDWDTVGIIGEKTTVHFQVRLAHSGRSDMVKNTELFSPELDLFFLDVLEFIFSDSSNDFDSSLCSTEKKQLDLAFFNACEHFVASQADPQLSEEGNEVQ